MQRVALAVGLAAIAIACRDAPERSPYRVEVDLAPALKALGSDDLFESDPGEEKIVALGADALPALRAAMTREEPAVRAAVVGLLPRLGGAEALEIAIEAARADAHPEVRYEAFRTLAAFGDPRPRFLVESSLASDEPRTQLGAIMACAPICVSADAIARLAAIAVDGSPAANANAARASLLRVLKGRHALRARAAREAIVARAVPAATAGATPEVRLRAALLASDIGEPVGMETLMRAVQERTVPALTVHAVYALGTIGDARAVPVVAAVDGDETLQRYAFQALVQMHERGVAEAKPVALAWTKARPEMRLPPPAIPY